MLLLKGLSGLAFHPYNTRMIAYKGLNGLTFHPYNRRMIAYNLSLQRQQILRITNRGGSASLLRRKQAKSKLPGVFPRTRCRRHPMHEFVVRPERMRSTGYDLSVPHEASLPPTARVLFPKKKHPTDVRGEDLCWFFLCRLQPIFQWERDPCTIWWPMTSTACQILVELLLRNTPLLSWLVQVERR